MNVWIDIHTPSAGGFSRVDWPKEVPYPAIGDKVLFRSNEVTWVFGVLARTIGIGTDPISGLPAANVSLTVDSEAPEEFRP